MYRFALVLVFLLSALAASTSDAQPGRLLKSNTYPGTVTALGSGPTFSPTQIFEDSTSGLTTAWGTCFVGVNYFDVCAVRLLANGVRDLSFGSNGIVLVSQESTNTTAGTVVKRSGGGFLIGGACGGQTCLTAVSELGNLDPTFGTAGRKLVAIPGLVAVLNVLDDMYLIVGRCEYTSLYRTYCVERYTNSGMLDPTYGDNGRRIVSSEPVADIVSAAIDANGRLLLGGDCSVIAYGACVWRITANGNLDATWGFNGKKLAFNLSNSGPVSLLTEHDNFVFSIGRCNPTSSSDAGVCISKLSSTTSVFDTTFGTNGVLFVAGEPRAFHAIRADAFNSIRSLLTNASGETQLLAINALGGSAATAIDKQTLVLPFTPNIARIDSVGVTTVASSTYNGVGFTFSRFRANGQPDIELNRDGLSYAVSGDRYSTNRWAKLISTANAGLYGVLECDHTRPGDAFAVNAACIVKMNADGSQSRTFGTNGGWAYVPIGIQTVGAVAIAADSALHLYVLNECRGQPLSFCVTKLTPSGMFDTTYASEGTASLSSLDLSYASEIEIDPLNRALVSGACSTPNGIRPCVFRLTSSGHLDTSFAESGRRLIDAAPVGDLGGVNLTMKLRLFSDGSILLGKVCLDQSSVSRICIAKLTIDGALHPDFGNVEYVASIEATWLSDLILDNDKAIVLAQCDARPCMLKLTSGGLVDSNAFPGAPDVTDGVIRPSTTSETAPFGNSLAIQRGGRIAVAGSCANDIKQICVALYLPTGAADTDFGVNGSMKFGVGSSAVTGPTVAAVTTNTIVLSAICEDTLLETNPFLGIREACHARLSTVASSRFDVDNDYVESAETDGVIILRHLFGFSGDALIANATAHYGDRVQSDEIATYLSQYVLDFPQCTTSIVGLPTNASATVDGLILLRVMLGLTGDAALSGINFPPGTLRSTWSEIKMHLVANCGMSIAQ
jgi:uncharacterized delta-60 repeat protein